jgi:ankyrin repeat protein
MERQEAIIAAVKAKDAAQVESLLNEDPSLVETRTPDGSLVLTAAYRGAWELVQLLLAHNATLDIFEAAVVGQADRIKALLADEPGLADAVNNDGFSPLHLAAFVGQVDAVRTLLAGGADINKVQQSKVPYVPSNTALHAAIAGGPHREVVELLVTAGADVNVISSIGHTPLHDAVFHNATELLAYLLAHGADVNRSGEGVPTPLAYARQRGKEEAAALLASAGGEASRTA